MENIYNQLQIREIFHLEFLRWFGKKIKAEYYALKGGVNLRFFYDSFRYSEDIDLDVHIIRVDILQDEVMQILESSSFQDNLKSFGIYDIISSDIIKAKQTETTQRLKVHLITANGEDFFTKIEFSRRGFKNNIKIETVSNAILREYKIAPLLIPHYDIISTVSQKLEALATRTVIQGRDIFDLYILSTQFESSERKRNKLSKAKINQAYENVFKISFEQFKDTVIAYLSKEDQRVYHSRDSWDEIKLKTAHFIEELKRGNENRKI